MGRYENRLDSDLSWMTDMIVDLNDFEPVESAIPLFEDALELPWPSPSSSFSALFQLDTADTASDHPANAAWNANATMSSAEGVRDIDKFDAIFDCERYCKGRTFDRDQFRRPQSQR